MLRPLSLAFFILVSLVYCANAQSIQLPSGQSIAVGNYVELYYLPNIRVRSDSNTCCPTHRLLGEVVAIEGTLLRIQADEADVADAHTPRKKTKPKSKLTQYEPRGTGPTIAVEYAEIFNGEIAKSKKKYYGNKSRGVIGGISILTGIATGISALIVSDKESRKRLLLVAGAEIAFAIPILSFGKPKKFALRVVPESSSIP